MRQHRKRRTGQADLQPRDYEAIVAMGLTEVTPALLRPKQHTLGQHVVAAPTLKFVCVRYASSDLMTSSIALLSSDAVLFCYHRRQVCDTAAKA
jgi:hypothetical protein